jgi:hypothetical protein
MNDGCRITNGGKHTNLSLVHRPSIAVEKAAADPKQILSGMVTPTQIGLIEKMSMQCSDYGGYGL